MCSFGSCQTRFEFLSQFRKVRNAFECFVTQVQTHLPKTKRVWPMKINVICTVDHLIEMHDKPHTFLTLVDKTSVHRQDLYGVAICVRSFEFTTGGMKLNPPNAHRSQIKICEKRQTRNVQFRFMPNAFRILKPIQKSSKCV